MVEIKLSCIAALVVLVLLAILIYKTINKLIKADQILDNEDIDQQNY